MTLRSSPSGRLPLDNVQLDERRRAVRALLRKPLLLAEEPADLADFARVRRFADDLREWFSRQAGWSLDVTPEFARLRKTPGDLRDETRPAFDLRGEPFTRRRYILLCLTLAALVRADRQTTLGRVANEIVSLWGQEATLGDAGLTFRLESQEDRRDLVQVMRVLLLWQVVRRVDGAEERFLHADEDVLYNVRHMLLARLLAVRRAPSLVTSGEFEGRLTAIVEEPLVVTEEQKKHRLKRDFMRRLLDDPVIYYRELTAEEQTYLQRQRWHMVAQVRDATGLVPEERAEGVAMTDPFGDCSDLGMPEEGTDGHATILVAEFLAARRSTGGDMPVPMGAVEDFLAVKAGEHRRHWRREATLPGSERDLAKTVISRLAQLGLVRKMHTGVVPMPALHRFRLREDHEK